MTFEVGCVFELCILAVKVESGPFSADHRLFHPSRPIQSESGAFFNRERIMLRLEFVHRFEM